MLSNQQIYEMRKFRDHVCIECGQTFQSFLQIDDVCPECEEQCYRDYDDETHSKTVTYRTPTILLDPDSDEYQMRLEEIWDRE
jgi:predicted  nucleic acid-binding Zn-ribbon protein